MYLATTMTLSFGLSLCAGKEEEAPTYLWRSCDESENSNLYNTKLEVDNIFNNDTFNMADYGGQVLMILNVASF